MKGFHAIFVFLLCALLTGCGGSSAPTPSLPPAAQVNTPDVMRVGDKIDIRLSGVPDGEYVIQVLIPSSGTINVPLLTRSFQAAGRTTADLAAEIAAAYKTDKIYSNPNISVIPEDRYVNIGGDVRSPSRVIYTPDMTLLTAINACGGFDEYADRKHVRITRGQQIIVIDAVQATRVPGTDPALYPGDQIYVPRTPF